jgi:kynureninase
MAPLGPALALFDEAGISGLRHKSVRLTGYLEWLIREAADGAVELLTPSDPERRGAQLSLRVPRGARAVQEALQAADVVGDFREPDVVRLAPAPLFNTYHEMWRTAEALRSVMTEIAR